jgi:hypothetical protein
MATEVVTLGVREARGNLSDFKEVIVYGLANNTLSITKANTGLDYMDAVEVIAIRLDTATARTVALTTFNWQTAVLTSVDALGDSADCTVYVKVLGRQLDAS